MLFVLSPAKSLNFNSLSKLHSSLRFSNPTYLVKSDTIVECLQQKSKSQIKTLLKLSDSLGTLNHDRIQKFVKSKLSSQCSSKVDEFKPSILAYNGGNNNMNIYILLWKWFIDILASHATIVRIYYTLIHDDTHIQYCNLQALQNLGAAALHY